jgi:hypothetical protein
LGFAKTKSGARDMSEYTLPNDAGVHEAFSVRCFDETLRARTNEMEWARIIHMRDQPHALNMLHAYHRLMLPFFADKVILNKIVTEAWRFEMLVYSLYLYDRRDLDDPRSGLTVSNLERVCKEMNCASPGRVRAIIGIVQLEPSSEFINIVEGWNNRIFQISDIVFVKDNLAQSHRDNNRLGWEMRNRGCKSLFEGWKLLDPFPEVFHFVSSDGGWMLLLHCASEALRVGNNQYITPVRVDLATFGAKFGVSRSHLRRLLESAYKEGLLREPPKNGSNIVLSPHLLASYLTCMAAEISFYRAHGLAARTELAPPANSQRPLAPAKIYGRV